MLKNIKIQSNTVQYTSYWQIEQFCHDYLKIQTKLSDISYGFKYDSNNQIELNITINCPDGVYEDCKNALEEVGVTIQEDNIILKRVLDKTANTSLYNKLKSIVGNTLTENLINSQELNNITGTLTINSSDKIANFLARFNTQYKDTTYNVLDFLKNITSLNCKNCETLSGNVDITKNDSLTNIDLSNTKTTNIIGLKNKSNLTTVKYHTPTEINIENCLLLNI